MIEANHKIKENGIYITDIMYVFKANNPASELNSGQQKNRYFFCWKLPKHCPYHVLSKCPVLLMFDKCNN